MADTSSYLDLPERTSSFHRMTTGDDVITGTAGTGDISTHATPTSFSFRVPSLAHNVGRGSSSDITAGTYPPMALADDRFRPWLCGEYLPPTYTGSLYGSVPQTVELMDVEEPHNPTMEIYRYTARQFEGRIPSGALEATLADIQDSRGVCPRTSMAPNDTRSL